MHQLETIHNMWEFLLGRLFFADGFSLGGRFPSLDA
jgi:hypothetical protein